MATSVKDFKQILDSYIEESVGILYQYGGSKVFRFWKLFKEGGNWKESVDTSIAYLRTLSNTNLYWYDRGVTSPEELILYSTQPGWRVCPEEDCRKIHQKSEGHKSCCSESCYKKRRLKGNAKLSESRLKYNSRDPAQYAERHNISIEDAAKKIQTFVYEGTVRRPEFWIAKGHTEDEAKEIVSKRQATCSPRRQEYWIARGMSQTEAIDAVREYQSNNGKQLKIKYGSCRQFSVRCMEYWIARGYSEAEAKIKVSEIQSQTSRMCRLKYTDQERRAFNVWCFEYWLTRYPDVNEATRKYEEWVQSRNIPNYRSKIGDEFCAALSEKFSWLESNRYYGTREYTRYFKELNRVVKYDYVDTKLKIVVEFNGDFWHANPNRYKPGDMIQVSSSAVLVDDIWKRDAEKIAAITAAGYEVYVVWESDYCSDKVGTIQRLYEEIMDVS